MNQLKDFRNLTNYLVKTDGMHRDIAEVKARDLLYKGKKNG